MWFVQLCRYNTMVLLLIPLGFVLVSLLVWLRPLALRQLNARPGPRLDYSDAVVQIGAIQHAEQADHAIARAGYTRLFTHGKKTARALLFIHGLTNCPQQFTPLGRLFFERGYNVYIPRLPHHGLADRLTTEQSCLTAEELVAYADRSVDLAQALGEQLIVAGISGGANLVGWIAQERANVQLAVIIAPMFSVLELPAYVTRPLTSLALLLPNRFVWWDSKLKAEKPGPPYTYPRFSTRAMGQVLRLGYRVRLSAGKHPPNARHILVVTNAIDRAVNNVGMARIVRLWRRKRPAAVTEYCFPAEYGLAHDIIDPHQVEARIDMVYPILLELIDGRGPATHSSPSLAQPSI